MALRGTSDSDRRAIAGFAVALESGEYDLLPGDAKSIAHAAVTWANEKAQNDPMLGNGQDVRAIFALAEGITIGAMAWRAAVDQ